MKAYVMTTGAVFGLLVVVHVWRAIEEGPGIAKNPWFILVTAIAAGFCFWAWRTLGALSKGTQAPDSRGAQG